MRIEIKFTSFPFLNALVIVVLATFQQKVSVAVSPLLTPLHCTASVSLRDELSCRLIGNKSPGEILSLVSCFFPQRTASVNSRFHAAMSHI